MGNNDTTIGACPPDVTAYTSLDITDSTLIDGKIQQIRDRGFPGATANGACTSSDGTIYLPQGSFGPLVEAGSTFPGLRQLQQVVPPGGSASLSGAGSAMAFRETMTVTTHLEEMKWPTLTRAPAEAPPPPPDLKPLVGPAYGLAVGMQKDLAETCSDYAANFRMVEKFEQNPPPIAWENVETTDDYWNYVSHSTTGRGFAAFGTSAALFGAVTTTFEYGATNWGSLNMGEWSLLYRHARYMETLRLMHEYQCSGRPPLSPAFLSMGGVAVTTAAVATGFMGTEMAYDSYNGPAAATSQPTPPQFADYCENVKGPIDFSDPTQAMAAVQAFTTGLESKNPEEIAAILAELQSQYAALDHANTSVNAANVGLGKQLAAYNLTAPSEPSWWQEHAVHTGASVGAGFGFGTTAVRYGTDIFISIPSPGFAALRDRLIAQARNDAKMDVLGMMGMGRCVGAEDEANAGGDPQVPNDTQVSRVPIDYSYALGVYPEILPSLPQVSFPEWWVPQGAAIGGMDMPIPESPSHVVMRQAAPAAPVVRDQAAVDLLMGREPQAPVEPEFITPGGLVKATALTSGFIAAGGIVMIEMGYEPSTQVKAAMEFTGKLLTVGGVVYTVWVARKIIMAGEFGALASKILLPAAGAYVAGSMGWSWGGEQAVNLADYIGVEDADTRAEIQLAGNATGATIGVGIFAGGWHLLKTYAAEYNPIVLISTLVGAGSGYLKSRQIETFEQITKPVERTPLPSQVQGSALTGTYARGFQVFMATLGTFLRRRANNPDFNQLNEVLKNPDVRAGIEAYPEIFYNEMLSMMISYSASLEVSRSWDSAGPEAEWHLKEYVAVHPQLEAYLDKLLEMAQDARKLEEILALSEQECSTEEPLDDSNYSDTSETSDWSDIFEEDVCYDSEYPTSET
ncbi:hypothetical protein K1X76_08060 [bacterium]|nr:hypothetical protein [bacterium]